MPTVIDSLVVMLGLDSKQLETGSKDAVAAITKTRQEFVRQGKAMEEQTKKLDDGMKMLSRRALEFFALLMGANGLKEFISNAMGANASLGYLSKNLGITKNLGWRRATTGRYARIWLSA